MVAGRPRDPELEQRLLAATWSLLTTHGYGGLTLAKVAADAGAHRTDIYRRWSTKAQLVVDALAAYLPPLEVADTGSLLGDIRSYVDSLAASWSSPWIDGIMGLGADLRLDPDAELAFAVVGDRRGQGMRDAMGRAVARGEIEAPALLGLAGDLLEGPLMHRRMIARQPLTPEFLDAVATMAHQVLAARKPVV